MLAKRHLSGGTLVLYDVTSSYMEGRCCPLARFGYNRDGKKGKLQIVYGLLCAPDGCPVAVEVFEGSTGDPATLGSQVAKLKQRFGLDHVVLVGDRGMITDARIAEDIQPAGLDWITALRAPAIRGLLDGGAFQMSLFDDRDMATITSPDFPGERLILCRNAALAAERARKREDLLRATERDLAPIAAAVQRKREPLRGKAEIGLAVGAVIGKHKMAKHFALDITDTSFAFARKTAAIAEEAALDGLYAVRTSLPETALDDSKTVKSYKSLSLVEHAIRSKLRLLATFNQALDMKACVKKGEKGTQVVFTKRIPRDDDEEHGTISMLKTFYVFNVQQIDGLERIPTPELVDIDEGDVNQLADRFIAATKADIRIGGSKACFVPSQDFIAMPPREAFEQQLLVLIVGQTLRCDCSGGYRSASR